MRGAARPPRKPTGVDAYIRRLVRRERAPGLGVALARGGRRVYTRGFGWRDREARQPVTDQTIFGIASMTKSVTAAALLALQEDGRLAPEDSVRRHLPEYRTPRPAWARRTRLHHLLTHTSGLPPLPTIYYEMLRSLRVDDAFEARELRRVGMDIDREPIESYEALLDYLAHERYRPLGPPGAVFSYSNEGFALLGAVIERASGQSFESFVQDRILRPAGMHRSGFDSGAMFRQPEVATLYSPVSRGGRRRVIRAPVWHELSCMRPTGGLRSTLADLLRYLEIVRTGGRVDGTRILAPNSVRALTTPYVETLPGRYYGYGWFVVPDFHGRRVVYHSGGLKGVSSYFAAVPECGLTGAALANVEDAPSHLALGAALNSALGLPLGTPFVRVARLRVAPGPLTRYVGEYRSGEGIWLRIRSRRRDLRVDFVGIEITGRNRPAKPVGPDAFVIGPRGDEFYLRFRSRRPGSRPEAVQAGSRIVRRRSPAEIARARTGGWTW